MTFTKYLIGDPASGPFADFTATDDAAALRYVTDNYGPVLDTVDWTDEDGQPVPLLIVAADDPLYDLPDPGDDTDVQPDPGFWDRLDAADADRRAAIEADADDAELRGAYGARDRILAGRRDDARELKIDIIVYDGEDATDVARSLIGPKGRAELISVGWEGGQWPTATYRGTTHQLATIQAKSEGRPIGRPRTNIVPAAQSG